MHTACLNYCFLCLQAKTLLGRNVVFEFQQQAFLQLNSFKVKFLNISNGNVKPFLTLFCKYLENLQFFQDY